MLSRMQTLEKHYAEGRDPTCNLEETLRSVSGGTSSSSLVHAIRFHGRRSSRVYLSMFGRFSRANSAFDGTGPGGDYRARALRAQGQLLGGRQLQRDTAKRKCDTRGLCSRFTIIYQYRTHIPTDRHALVSKDQ